MCGATGPQEELQAMDIQTLQQYDQIMQQQYANQTALYTQVNSVLQPILQAGPSQQGFSAGEENALNAQAIEGTATNYTAAQKALGEQAAGEGGGNEAVSSGAEE